MKGVAGALMMLAALAAYAQTNFNGAWLHTVYQEQYSRQTTAENQAYLCGLLDELSNAGINAIFFQVRPSADAFYDSRLEPWSRFLVPDRKTPEPYWDPLAFMVDECHKRDMQLHAWLNPYRVTTAKNEHRTAPEGVSWVRFSGDGKLYFDPGEPANRDFIVKVVSDIITRYDVDGIHFDDYFYPYPVKGHDFPDDASYRKYGDNMDRGDWRRQNVDLLIEAVHNAITFIRPEVRFGISPFGIWRNKSTDPAGSETSGLQNYDDLYADPLNWARQGWVDYLMPQLYWELDHPRASYRVLVEWWARNIPEGCDLYIGQDVEKCMKFGELDTKLSLGREYSTIQGHCWWPGYAVVKYRDAWPR